jgi:DNA-binding NarL/FixJ family response regulator
MTRQPVDDPQPQEPTKAVRVLVVDDQQLMRDGLTSLLSIQEGIEVVGSAANGQEAIEHTAALHPDVILMDVRMPVLDGVAATTQLHRQAPECQIIMLTTFDDDEYIIEALRAGASGYLLKDLPAHRLAQAIQAVHQHIYQLDPAVASRLIASTAMPRSQSGGGSPATISSTQSATLKNTGLTEREMDVLRLIAQGATNREIAEYLVISEGTVKNHISNILGRLSLRDRTQAAIFARENGLLS